VTDRDGLQRIDDEKWVSDKSQGLNSWDWPTQRPAWMEGTAVQDKVLAKPETYRMVVNEADYEAIRTAVQRGILLPPKDLAAGPPKTQ
jgi:filamentous hemagglutinin